MSALQLFLLAAAAAAVVLVALVVVTVAVVVLGLLITVAPPVRPATVPYPSPYGPPPPGWGYRT